jgi:hypothetical protein
MYETGLEDWITDLHNRVHRRAYRALPSRRVFIEKGDGRKRPLGIAALEDKIVQLAGVTILNQIYEEDFLGFSSGFVRGAASGAVVSPAAMPWFVASSWPHNGFLNLVCSIPIPLTASPPVIRDKSRMR